MKKTYIIPALKTYKVRTSRMIATSLSIGTSEVTEEGDANSNSLDDQSGPWYRR